MLEQFFGPHRGSDRIQHDADDFRELLEESDVDIAEPVERSQLEHCLDLAFEQHRQDDDIDGRRLAQGRADLDVVGRHFGKQDPLLFESRFPHQSLAGADAGHHVLACIEGIAGEKPEIRLTVRRIVDEENTVLNRR